jgi:hypothetical protein
MTTMIRSAMLGLGLTLALAAFAAPASAQPPSKEPPAKEPTDGFFDVPPRPPGEEAEAWGLPAYMVTSAIGGLGVFILCKSARRS